MAVVYVRIDKASKELLVEKAKKLQMPLTTYCRMLLLQSLNGNKQEVVK